MTTGQLRGYFSWRTKLRRGVYERAPLSFAFVYMYELINGVGASSPLDAFIKLRTFAQEYAEIDERVVPYAGRWLFDLAVYHGLDPSLLESEFVFTNTDSAVDLCACTDDERIKSIYSDAAYYCKHAVSYKNTLKRRDGRCSASAMSLRSAALIMNTTAPLLIFPASGK